MTVAELITDFLKSKNIDTVFTVLGGNSIFLNKSIEIDKYFKVIYMHHEQSCAMAAEGYFKMSNKPAAVLLSSGPAGINALNGVIGAWMDSVPIFVISGQVKSVTSISLNKEQNVRQLGDQDNDIVNLTKNFTKFSCIIKATEDVNCILENAYKSMMSDRLGPVWIDIPIDIQSAQVREFSLKYTEFKPIVHMNLKNEIELLVAKLSISLRPIILLGNGVRYSNSLGVMQNLIEYLKIPVLTAWNAHDILSNSNPYYCGRPGTLGTRDGNFITQGADFILVLGSRLNVRQVGYNFGEFGENAYISMVDIDPNELNKLTLNVDLKIQADLRFFLDELLIIIKKTSLKSWSKWLSVAKGVHNDYHIPEIVFQNKNGKINPYSFFFRFFDRLGDDNYIVTADGSACVITFQVATIKSGTRLFTNSGFASMGYGLPASIGASFSLTDNGRLFCIEGDGSLQMNIQEIATIKAHNNNIIIMIINNDGYLSIKNTQKNFFGSHFFGVSESSGLYFPNYEYIAKAYDLKYKLITADNEDYFLDNLTNITGPMIIELLVDGNVFFQPKNQARINQDGSIESSKLDDMYPFLDRDEYEAVKMKIKNVE